MMKCCYIVLICHGEYDDYVECPVAVTADRASADLLAEALEQKKSPYFEDILETKGFKYWRDIDFSTNIVESVYVEI